MAAIEAPRTDPPQPRRLHSAGRAPIFRARSKADDFMRARATELILVALALSGCAASTSVPATAPPPNVPPALTPERVTALIAEVARLRNLPQRVAVPVYLLDKPHFLAALHERIDRQNVTRDEIEEQKAFHLAFDLLPNGEPGGQGRVATASEVLEERVLGFYDRERHQIVVRASQAHTRAEAEKELGILAHEIEHALQDQNFGRPATNTMSDDEQLAHSAVLEGDAMLTMFAYLASERGVPFQRMVRRAAEIMRDLPPDRFVGNDGESALLRALPMMRERLLFRYHAGTGLVAECYRAGGLELVNRLLSIPPVSTEQVLHPEKYLSGELPVEVRNPEPPPAYKTLGHGTLGELSIRVVLERCTPAATNAAEGWGGDRYTIASGPDGSVALLWSTVWDSEKDAAEFATALTANPGCLRALSLGQTSIHDGLVVRSSGAKVAVARGLSQNVAEELVPRLFELPQPSKNPPVALPYRMLPGGPLPVREPGWFAGNIFHSRYLGISGMVPIELGAFVDHQGFGANGAKGDPKPQMSNPGFELRVSRPDMGGFGGLLLSDLLTTPQFQEKIFADIVTGLSSGAPGKTLDPLGGGNLLTPLGAAIERWWSIRGTNGMVRVVMIPICGGTGSLVFLHSFSDSAMRALLDGWMYSFRWNTNVKPPVCEMLDPR